MKYELVLALRFGVTNKLKLAAPVAGYKKFT